MQYFVSFLEGMITFISPCLLPMLPIYISYFAGGGERSVKKSLIGAAGFVTGFTLVFVAMGALAGTVGSLLRAHQSAVNFISGMIVILFGLNFLGVFRGFLPPRRCVSFPGQVHRICMLRPSSASLPEQCPF